MNNIYTDVIVYKDRVGKLIEDKDYKLFRFYPAGYGSYYKSELEIVENPESEVTIANSAQGKVYALAEFGRYCLFGDYIYINDNTTLQTKVSANVLEKIFAKASASPAEIAKIFFCVFPIRILLGVFVEM